MKSQVNIRISKHTRRQLDQLQEHMSTTQTDVISIAIDRMARKELNMNTYYVEPDMLGDDATEADANRMVELLQERGINAERGNALDIHEQWHEHPTLETAWDDALNIISREKYS